MREGDGEGVYDGVSVLEEVGEGEGEGVLEKVGVGVREEDGDCEADGVGVLVLVGVVPPLHLNVTCASSDTGASLSPLTQAIFLKLISLVGHPGSCAVTQYTI